MSGKSEATADGAVHGTAVLAGSTGILLRGPSGSGKSMLALALMEHGARLVADDRVFLFPRGGRLIASPPSEIAGLVELRGVGILSYPYEQAALIHLVVDLVEPGELARLPLDGELATCLAGIAVARQPVPAPGSAGALEPALLMVRHAVGKMRDRGHDKALHLTLVSP